METRFGAFKTALCEDLKVEDCRKLCAYFEVSSAKTDLVLGSRPQGLALLEVLEGEGKITSTDTLNLSDAFKHLKMGRLAKKVEEYENSLGFSETSALPDDLESDEDTDETESRPCNMSFEEFKTKCGLRETLTLKKMLEVKSPGRNATLAELFWEKITSLDYRIASSEFTKDLSVRDLVFATLHSSNNVLRQDIIAKMTSCQLAVPLVLNGVNNRKPVLLYWAFMTIRKKIQTLNGTDPIERPMYKYDTLTVSFLRIGDIRFSKSDLLNSLLSECQGNQAHSFYISRKGDLTKPSFSNGSIEVVWYIPEAGDKGILESTTTFLNLRGDSQKFQFQTEFLCKVSSLTFVLIGKQNWKRHKAFLENIQKMAANVLVLAIRENDDEKAVKYLNFKHEGVIVVQKFHMSILNEEICSRINESIKAQPKLWSLENIKDHVQGIVELDISNEYLATIKGHVESIVPEKVDITQFKNNILRLFPIWVEWAGLDQMTYTTESGIEQQRVSREEEKISKRKQQLTTNISQEVRAFWDLLKLVGCKSDLFDDCLIYLQTLLFDLTHVQQGCSKSAQKFLHDRLSEKASDSQVEMELDLSEVYSNEQKVQWQMSIGIEDFMRELGQLFEASVQCKNDQTNKVDLMRLPALAAQFIANGNPLEMLDDKSYCVPVCWIMNILEELRALVGENAKVFVLSVIGIQGSGKSTLLNTMFGTKFPVSAGRCTRGLFLRLLKVKESFAESIGCNFILVVDTEGLKADHGGLDEVSSTRLDNKMVTLAMCIADLIIVNIEGENLGSDMTNFLQIAAYALIRMKEVDLQAQCRIIQQRVSDITASAKNKANMIKIISNLDKAVKNVAEAEGFVDRYESFSDIFQLKVNDHTQYVCNLWSGNMNPPNHLYGKVVINFREEIFDTVSNGRLNIHFTFKTFWGRLLAVHEALKEENFVLKFEDVSRAITYNEFSLQCNNWLCDVRVKVKASWVTWQRRMAAVSDEREREGLCETLKDELLEEMGKHRNTINKQYQSYITNNEKGISFYNEYFNSWIEASLSKIECDIKINISNEAKALKWAARDIPSFVFKEAQKLRKKAIEKATSLRENGSEQIDPSQLQQYFDEYWEDSIKSTLETFQSRRVSNENIMEECTRILINLCNGNAIESDVVRLLKKEGNILTHGRDFNSDNYIANKTVSMTEKLLAYGPLQKMLKKREKIREDITPVVERVKTSTIAQFKTDCNGKSFDGYLVYTTLQKALSDLTFGEGVQHLKLPSSLIAKVLLHLCGIVSEIAIKNDTKYHKDNSCQNLFHQHEKNIYFDFMAFYEDSYQNLRAFMYVWELVSQQIEVFTLDRLRSRIVRYFCNVLQTKSDMHYMVLEYLLHENKPVLYLDYIHNNGDFLISWMKEKMIHKFVTKQEDMSWIQLQYKQVLKGITPLPRSTVKNLSKATSMEEWCENFSQVISNQQGLQLDLKEAHLYQVSDFTLLSENVFFFWQFGLVDITDERAEQLPGVDDLYQAELLLELKLSCPFKDVIDNFLGCRERCPFCKAPCREENVSDHNHQAFCHYPRGLAGRKWDNNKLVEQSCVSSVASKDVVYEKEGNDYLYKDYKRHFPFWTIPIKEPEESLYWAWVFQNINEYCSKYYSCDPAEIPVEWSSLLPTRDFILLKIRARRKSSFSARVFQKVRDITEVEETT